MHAEKQHGKFSMKIIRPSALPHKFTVSNLHMLMNLRLEMIKFAFHQNMYTHLRQLYNFIPA